MIKKGESLEIWLLNERQLLIKVDKEEWEGWMGISFSWSLKFIIFFMKCFEGLETERNVMLLNVWLDCKK